jgi:endonuclease YncB( thermonuclease family)
MGAAGAGALGRGAAAAARKSYAMGSAGFRAADTGVRAGLPVAFAAIQTFVAAFGRAVVAALAVLWSTLQTFAAGISNVSAPAFSASWERLEPSIVKLRKPSVTLVLIVVAAVAFVGSFRRVAANGWSIDIVIALMIGTLIICALLAAWLADGPPAWLAAGGRATGNGAARLVGGIGRLAPSGESATRIFSIAVVVLVVAGFGWLLWRGLAAMPSLFSGAAPLQGRALALSGDTLRIAKRTVSLAGIEAPLDGQTCQSSRSRSWRCDRAARAALAHLLRDGDATCELSGTGDDGRQLAACTLAGRDVAAELVRDGHVFAAAGYFSGYAELEDAAREAKRGVWAGKAERPEDYRTRKWDEAERDAPDGCPIKGDVARGRKVYVLPWSPSYSRVRVTASRGERWFCSESEAQAAGWEPAERP